MTNDSSRHRPERLADILSELFAARGYARRTARSELETAWEAAAGERTAQHTRVGSLRRGVLEILVDHSVLLQELSQFQKPTLLAALRKRISSGKILDLKFRQVGSLPK